MEWKVQIIPARKKMTKKEVSRPAGSSLVKERMEDDTGRKNFILSLIPSFFLSFFDPESE